MPSPSQWRGRRVGHLTANGGRVAHHDRWRSNQRKQPACNLMRSRSVRRTRRRINGPVAKSVGLAPGRPGLGFLGCLAQEVLGVASGMDDLPRNAHARSSGEEYRTLLAVAEAIVSHRDLHALFHDLTGRLRQVVRFDYLILVL